MTDQARGDGAGAPPPVGAGDAHVVDGARGGADGSGGRQPWRPDRRVVALGAALLVVLLVCGTWIVVRGLLARSHLEAARTQISQLAQQISAGRTPSEAELRSVTAEIMRRTSAARALTSDPVWSAAGRLPLLGCPLRATATLTTALDEVAGRTMPAAVELGRHLDPATLMSGSTLNVSALASARTPAERARDAVNVFTKTISRVPECGRLGGAIGLTEARAEVVRQGDQLHGALDTLALVTRIGPGILGANEPRRYLVIVQNPSESRANGGIIGGFGVLTASRGHLALDSISGNNSLPGGPTLTRSAAELPPELAVRYGQFWPDRIWANVNLTPHYPTAGWLYTELYREATGERLDGTLSLDPTTLSYLLAATRPAVLPDGRVVRADELTELVESRVYAEIADTDERDAFFAAVGSAVYEAVTSGSGNTASLFRALARAVSEGRLLMSSSHAEEQRVIESTPLGGALAQVPGPFLAVVTQNATASKLDYWVRRQTSYLMSRQPDGSGVATITIRISNAAPEGLSKDVRARGDLRQRDGSPWDNPDAQNSLWLSLYTGRGSWFIDAQLDGQPASLTTGQEQGRPVFSTYLTVDRGQTRTLQVRVLEPVAGPALTVRPQPLTTPEELVVRGLPVISMWSRNVTE